jgi:hypothetical protein
MLQGRGMLWSVRLRGKGGGVWRDGRIGEESYRAAAREEAKLGGHGGVFYCRGGLLRVETRL